MVIPNASTSPNAAPKNTRLFRRLAACERCACTTLSLTALLLFCIGCSSVGLPAAATGSYYTNAPLSQVHLFKPAETGTQTLAFSLAPLVLTEVAGSNLPPQDCFGALTVSNAACLITTSKPIVYFFSDAATLKGKPCVRQTYCWFYSGGNSATNLICAQGVRLTVNADGFPVVWEVLSTASAPGPDAVYVAQSLERAARAIWGLPLAGRRYACERSLAEAPNTVVARILEDGPVPMGPIVYLSVSNHLVHTVICRCMPSEAKSILGSGTYDLAPFPAGEECLSRLESAAGAKLRSWLTPGLADSIENRLRLGNAPREDEQMKPGHGQNRF